MFLNEVILIKSGDDIYRTAEMIFNAQPMLIMLIYVNYVNMLNSHSKHLA